MKPYADVGGVNVFAAFIVIFIRRVFVVFAVVDILVTIVTAAFVQLQQHAVVVVWGRTKWVFTAQMVIYINMHWTIDNMNPC